MRLTFTAVLTLALHVLFILAADPQILLADDCNRRNISVALFSELEELSRVVDIAYCVGLTGTGVSKPFKCLSRCSEFPDFELVATWNTGQLQSDSCGYVAVDHGQKRIFAAFRGTYSLANTIADLSTIPQKYEPYPGGDGEPEVGGKTAPKCENCSVHSGFHTSWVNTRKLVLPLLESNRLLYPGYQLHLVGHSLGGAVAALGGLELLIRGLDPIVTTFGEPRIGNKALSTYLNDQFGLEAETDLELRKSTGLKFRRVTHIDDPVPLLPLSEWGFAMHAGEIFISKYDLSPDVQDLELCQGNNDPNCIAGQDPSALKDAVNNGMKRRSNLPRKRDLLSIVRNEVDEIREESWGIPSRYKLWQLFFAHRDYFWRLGLCIPASHPMPASNGTRDDL